MLLAFLLSCSDHGVNEIQFGTLDVSPSSIALGGACGYEEHPVTLLNVGAYDVQVQSLHVDGDGWLLLESPPLPIRLAPGDAAEVMLLGQNGEGTLTVTSDDLDNPQQTVALSGVGNEPPSLEWVFPTAAIVEPGDPLQVQVADPSDALDDLFVAWSSDVDGSIDLAFADPTGLASIDWPDGTAGDHVLTATVTDTCGAETSVDRAVCRQGGFFGESLDLSTWEFQGDGRYDEGNGWVELTDTTGTFQLGSAFQSVETTGDDVALSFSFYVSGGSGADGFAVTALDTTRATTTLAHPGGCLGYGGGGICGTEAPLYGWTVEVDTYFSGGVDPTEQDHVSFHFDGDVVGWEAFANLPEMEDDSWHEMSIQVNAPRVVVAVDGVVYIDQDIPGHYDFPARVGFTAATGGETNFHLIDDLKVVESVCD